MFLVPNSRWFDKRCWMWFAPSVALLVPILKNCGLDVSVVEANIDNLSPGRIQQRIRDFKPDMVGITNMSLEYWRQAHFSAELVKAVDSSITVIMGGVHPTTLPEKVMEDPNIDFILMSEGERRLPEFLNIFQSRHPDYLTMDGIGYRQNGRVIINSPKGWIENLDSFPVPDYSLFQWQKVMMNTQKAVVGLGNRKAPVGLVMTSRGCRYKCCFCANFLSMGRKVRFRSPRMVLEEIDMLVEKHGIKELIFTDDEMYADRQRCVEIFEGLKQRRYDLIWKNANLGSWTLDFELMTLMKESGCYQIIISPESGNERVLKEIIHKPSHKVHSLNVARWCKELDIEIEADFVIGFPGETWDEIWDSVKFAEELDVDAVKFAIATPFPGTELFKKAVSGGYLPEDFEFYRDDTLGFAHGVIETEEFSPKELEMVRCLEWDRINFNTRVKREKYAEMNNMTSDELAEFRRATRRHLGVYFLDQAADERSVAVDPAGGPAAC